MNISCILSQPGFEVDFLEDLLGQQLQGNVEVVLTDPGYMRVLNRKYRHIDRSTDVLSFDLSVTEDSRPDGVIYVDGRVFPPYEAILELIFHGYLHLSGFSHDDSTGEAQMRSRVASMISISLKGQNIG